MFFLGMIFLIIIGILFVLVEWSWFMIFWMSVRCDLDRIDRLMICIFFLIVVLMIWVGVRWMFL